MKDVFVIRKVKIPNQALRYHRERRNWTQEQAAEALLNECGPGKRGEINPRMISRWERGDQIPSFEYREKLCRLYQVSSPEELGFLDREEVFGISTISQESSSSDISSTSLDIITNFSSNPTVDSSAPSLVGIFDAAQPVAIDEMTSESLGDFAALTNACRHLSEGNELQVAERTLWSYLPRVETIAKLSFEDQQPAADIASQGYLLAASLAGHRNDLQARHHYSEQALLYGKLAGDRNLQIAALRQLSITFDYLERPDKVLHIYKQAIHYLGEVSPLLRACVYAHISGSYTQLNQQQEALRFLELAYEHFPEKYDNEPSYLRAMCGYSTLVICSGLHHLDFGQPHEADKSFARIDGLQPKTSISERVRTDLLNCQVEVFAELKDMEQACHYLEVAGKASLAIGSERRFRESFTVFQQLQKMWKDEPMIRNLESLFIR